MALTAQIKQGLAALRQGPVYVQVDPDTVNLQFLHEGGITFNFTTGMEPQETDVIGVYDLISQGNELTFDWTNPENTFEALEIMFLGSSVSNDTSDYIGFGKTAGCSGRDSARAFRFSPYQCSGAISTDFYIDIWKALPEGDIATSWQKDDKYTQAVTFRALPDTTKANGEMLARFYAPNRS